MVANLYHVALTNRHILFWSENALKIKSPCVRTELVSRYRK
jgi:hypothetical protein